MKKSIVFDLDGTLINSAASIIISLQAAFDNLSILPIQPLSHCLIGPPLGDIITKLLGNQDKNRKSELIECFVEHYDTLGYSNTSVYPGIQEMLVLLLQQGYELYIATNKRLMPTEKILNHLGWTDFFKNVYSLDYFQPPLQHKSALLAEVIKDLNKSCSDLLYVGDRLEDAESAKNNDIPFCFASWGYGYLNKSIDIKLILSEPNDLLKYL